MADITEIHASILISQKKMTSSVKNGIELPEGLGSKK